MDMMNFQDFPSILTCFLRGFCILRTYCAYCNAYRDTTVSPRQKNLF